MLELLICWKSKHSLRECGRKAIANQVFMLLGLSLDAQVVDQFRSVKLSGSIDEEIVHLLVILQSRGENVGSIFLG
jgi:hypothetical protein